MGASMPFRSDFKPLARCIPIVVVGRNDFVLTQAGNDVESLTAPSGLDRPRVGLKSRAIPLSSR